MGGWDGEIMRDEMLRIDPSSQSNGTLPNWEIVSQLPEARAFLGAAVLNHRIYVVGGYDGQSERATAHAYQLSTNQWMGRISTTDNSSWWFVFSLRELGYLRLRRRMESSGRYPRTV